MHEPKIRHWNAAKRILRYLRGTIELKLNFPRSSPLQLTGFCDSDWAGEKDQRKSTSGFYFFLAVHQYLGALRNKPQLCYHQHKQNTNQQ